MKRHVLSLVIASAAVGGVAYVLQPDDADALEARPRVSPRAAQLPPRSPAAKAPARPRLMVVGCVRFTDPAGRPTGFDPRAADAPDQVARVVEGLEPFRPTRVLVERPAAASDDLDAGYRAFDPSRPAAATPEQMLGFAVARRLGHDRVYGIGGAGEEAAPPPARRGRRLAAGLIPRRRSLSVTADGGPPLTLRDRLMHANDPAGVRQRYGAELATAAGGDPTGRLAGEHHRRLRMFAAARAAALSGERVLAVVGEDTLGVLRLCVEGCADLELAEIAPYLGGPDGGAAEPSVERLATDSVKLSAATRQ